MTAQLFGAHRDAVAVRLCQKSCKSFACPTCGPLLGINTRDRLLDRYKKAGVQRVGLFTLTISDKVLGDTPTEQYETIRDRRLIGEFVRRVREVLGTAAGFFRVCEFGTKTGRPHYHLLVDGLGRMDPVSLAALQSWSQTHLGTMDYKYRAASRGVRYVCKYLTKGSDGSLPDFVLDMSGFKFFSVSRGFWMTPSEPRRPTTKKPVPRRQRTLRVRLHECGDGVIGLAQTVASDGEIRHRFAFAIPVPFRTIVQRLAERAPERIERTSSAWPTKSPRWVDVDPDLGRELAVWAYKEAARRRAAERLAAGPP